ncbi:MAG: OadG family protein [Eubacterium sp.]|nr:OadG family protein [Eubacterium sp.]
MAGEEITIPVALMHTGVSMGTVFIVLILISFVIYLLRFVPRLFEKKDKPVKEKKKDNADVSAVQKVSPAKGVAPAKKTADTELVAVIAAAIAATMTEETGVPVSPEGLVIRSIKKRSL